MTPESRAGGAAGPLPRIDLARHPEFRLGQLRVHPASCEIRGAAIHHIEPRVMQVLCALAETRGGVVSRDELIERCWNGRIVGEDSVSRCIARLRQIAQAEPDGFEIKTLTRVGYRLTVIRQAPVAPEPAPVSAPTPQPERPLLGRRSAAVALGAVGLLVCLLGWRLTHPARRWQVDQIKPFVTTEEGAKSPALSPSGDLVAYSAVGQDRISHIYLRNLAGGERAQLTSGSGETLPRWLPTGTRLAFRATAVGDPCRIMAIAIPAGPPRELLRCHSDDPLAETYAFSQDGKYLFYSDATGPLAATRLMRLDMASGVRTPLTDTITSGVIESVGDVSPDGSHLAFVRSVGAASGALMTLNVETGVTKSIWQVVSENWDAITWLDDQTLLTAWRRADDRALIAVTRSGDRTRLTSATQAFRSLSRGKDGLFAAQTDFAVQSLVSLGADGKPELRLASDGLVADPGFAADGSLAFIADSAGEQGLWVARPGKRPARIAGFGTHQAYHPSWSPDGKLIAVTQVIDHVPRLRVLDLDGATKQYVPLPAYDIGHVFWSADGQKLYIFTFTEAGSEWALYDLPIGRISQIHVGEWSQLRREGDTSYGVRAHVSGATRQIWRISPNPKLITDRLPMSRFGDWTIFHDQLYMVEAVDRTHDRLVRQTLDGKVEQTWPLGETPWLGGVAVDPVTLLPTVVQVSGGHNDIYLLRTSR